MKNGTGVKRPWRLSLIEGVKTGDTYEDICRYSGNFKSLTNAERAAEKWASENDYKLMSVETSCGYDVRMFVYRDFEAIEDEVRAFFEHCEKKLKQ